MRFHPLTGRAGTRFLQLIEGRDIIHQSSNPSSHISSLDSTIYLVFRFLKSCRSVPTEFVETKLVALIVAAGFESCPCVADQPALLTLSLPEGCQTSP